jgi:hypothetical protein
MRIHATRNFIQINEKKLSNGNQPTGGKSGLKKSGRQKLKAES